MLLNSLMLTLLSSDEIANTIILLQSLWAIVPQFQPFHDTVEEGFLGTFLFLLSVTEQLRSAKHCIIYKSKTNKQYSDEVDRIYEKWKEVLKKKRGKKRE